MTRYTAEQLRTMVEAFEALDYVTVPKMFAQAASDAETLEQVRAFQGEIRGWTKDDIVPSDLRELLAEIDALLEAR